MLEVLQFYVSTFWVWLGLTIGIAFAGGAVHNWIQAVKRK